jgi:Spy/CpxP family protein refolding chaperone
MRKFYINLALALLIFATFFGFVTWAQKTEDGTKKEGVTLEALGVTAEQKERIKALWEFKRQSHRQAIENLKPLNRLAKDKIASDDQVREVLKKFRQQHLAQEQKVKMAEENLLKSLPPRAQLHLTILGVLDNGLPPRFSTAPKREDNTPKPSDR